MDCSAEEAEIRRALDGFPSIRRLGFQLSKRTLVIDAPADDLPLILGAIRGAGFEPEPVATEAKTEDHDDHEHGVVGGLARYVGALALAVAAESISYIAGKELAWQIVGMVVATAAIALAGLDTYKKGWAALKARKLNINALMAVAVTGAFAIGQWPEAAMVMALYAIAELIEAKAVDRARNAIQGLLALAPEMAEVRQPDGTWVATAAKQVPVGAWVRVRPGERIALDGKVVSGSSAIDQSPVTGESIPVDKTIGDPVFAGTINQSGSLEFEVTAAANDTTLARIIHAVEEAQGTRAPTQRFVDQFSAIYTPAVFVIALLVALLTPMAMGITWLAAAYKALVLLVIACPCALVIATPVTVVSGLSAAARRGILIKGGTYLEEARKLKAVAFDKTGTITEGKPKLVHWQAVSTAVPAALAAQLAASLASRSDHPVSQAIAAGLEKSPLNVDGLKALTGRGIQGAIQDRTYVLGNHRLIEERAQCSAELEAILNTHESAGRTVTLLASDAEVLALFAVADTIKASSKEAIAALKSLGITPVMLTGDNQVTATTIAAEAGIADARGGLLPEDKLGAIRNLKASYGPTAMTGDGINDAPALAESDIGFAMGAAGTDTAVEAADVVVMNDDLRRIATTVSLSRKTYSILWQNIALALGIKGVFLVLAVFGQATMWMAVFADMGASLLVVGNGLRMLRDGDKP
jgi:Cd2+/Zn2+-exporting ATPase